MREIDNFNDIFHWIENSVKDVLEPVITESEIEKIQVKKDKEEVVLGYSFTEKKLEQLKSICNALFVIGEDLDHVCFYYQPSLLKEEQMKDFMNAYQKVLENVIDYYLTEEE